MNEKEIIAILLSEKYADFSLELAKKIHSESECLRANHQEILQSFVYAKEFVGYFGMEYCEK
ncbi:hypothetical protein [Helicobacter anatolicus]|uniref:hypothetical protein n=1 Tax=Helicobacter anatolicus TaxID=2905874 RepID=UPI001E33159D|nr:hypothetical protein [Helicobacter anatolicus]MCE3038676.1 hypothetical protein [Helicobacter anatolicus]MCE3040058.1 hypothetical protein [Helicobacter anatolicus]